MWDTMDRLDSQSTLSNWWRIHVVTKKQESVVGDIERGVRQGCVISPGLYNTYSERIMLCVVEEHHDGITIGGRKDTNLRCADDTTLLCTCNDELLALLKRVK